MDPEKPINDQLREQLRAKSLRMRDLFLELDGDGDGHISKADWRAWMQVICPDLPNSELDRAFDEVDTNHSGGVEFGELEAFLLGRKAGLDSELNAKAIVNERSAKMKQAPVPVIPRSRKELVAKARALPIPSMPHVPGFMKKAPMVLPSWRSAS